MKKTDYILIGVVLIAIVIGIISNKGNIVEKEIEFPVELSGEKGLTKIFYPEYKGLVASGEPFIVIIARSGCGYCQMYLPIVEEVANEKKISINYIDTDDLTSEEMTELSNKNRYLRNNNWGTPTTLFMVGNRIIDTIGGYVEKEEFISFLDGRIIEGE